MEVSSSGASKTVFLKTSMEDAGKMLDNLDRAVELIGELRDIFHGWGEMGIKLNADAKVKEIDDELIESIAEKVAEKLVNKF